MSKRRKRTLVAHFLPISGARFQDSQRHRKIIYLPVIVQRLNNITLSIVDQDSDTVDLRSEVITVRLNLK